MTKMQTLKLNTNTNKPKCILKRKQNHLENKNLFKNLNTLF